MPGAKKRVKEATGTPSVAAAAAATTDQPASTPRGPSSSPSSSPFRFPISSTVRKRAHVLSVDVGGGE